ncbi:I78 family peptidase inhibitor [Achromobacter xylosoxidans]|uniref:I78 family peptidase inhibitor n=1 Tax=Alcaligenes xylosoxydans xylosoxydans TaxID=85698 RepID=UPI0022B87468|nr:I78 family peptidase inhibitor [Achromobacter xylosoxidans]MCZ8393610.1 I78 family peptidase inhibitor [Achromobacter xylosoxidans]
MIRKLIPVLLVATLSACANTGAPRSSSSSAASSSSSSPAASDSSSGSSYGSPSTQAGARKACDASALQSQIGQKATQSVLEDLRTRSGAATTRILRPGQLVTMEYNDTRLNLIVDDKDVMTAIRCG